MTFSWAISACLFLLAPALPLEAQVSESAPLSREALAERFRTQRWDAKAPVDIQSRQMQVDFEEHRIVFLGEVRVTQTDFSLSAEEVTAVIGERAEDIRKIIARGNVRIQKADKVAWGGEAAYDREKAVIVLSGDPRLEQGMNFIRGDEIRVFLAEDRMEVAGGVRAEFRVGGDAPRQ